MGSEYRKERLDRGIKVRTDGEVLTVDDGSRRQTLKID